MDEAEKFAREALAAAGLNRYVLDITISVLTRKLKALAKSDPEIYRLMGDLEQVGDMHNRSFFTTRRAEIEMYSGNLKLAKSLAIQACDRTPNVFDCRRILCEVLLLQGDIANAKIVIAWMKDKVSGPSGEGRTNYRQYLVADAHYLTAARQYELAKRIYSDSSVFSPEESVTGIKEIELVQMLRGRS